MSNIYEVLPVIASIPAISFFLFPSYEVAKSRSINEPGFAFSKDIGRPVQHLRLEPWLRYYVATHGPHTIGWSILLLKTDLTQIFCKNQ